MNATFDQAGPARDDLEAATDQAIAACGGHARETVKVLLVANEFLEEQLDQLRSTVSTRLRPRTASQGPRTQRRARCLM